MSSDRVPRMADHPQTLTMEAGALAGWPGPAIVLSPLRDVLTASPQGEDLAEAVRNGRLPCLDALMAPPLSRTLVETLPTEGGGQMILELASLPLTLGRVLIIGRDITLERNLRSALVESRQRYKDLVEVSSDFAWETGMDGRLVFVSPKGALGFAADELVGRDPGELILSVVGDQASSPFVTAQSVEDCEVWMSQADGSQACILASATPIRGVDGLWGGARGICRDVTQERMRDGALARANNRERLLSYIVRTIRDELEPADMLTAAADATARALSATGCQIFRIMADDSEFRLAASFGQVQEAGPILDAFLATDHVDENADGWRVLAGVTRHRHSINGAIILWRAPDKAPFSDDDRLLVDDVANQVGLANEQIANHERILRLSRTDSLTGLFNRRAFFEEIARRFNRLAREGRPAALLYVDLDNFKAVNDVHGHQAGDLALLAVRDLLLTHTRPIDLVARLGGDEFAVWLEGAEEKIAIRRCEELLAAGRTLDQYSGMPDKPLHMSLGVAVHAGGSEESLDDLVARADRAMYQVKHSGKAAWRLAPPPGQGED